MYVWLIPVELFVELASEVTPSEDRPEGLLFVSLSLQTEATVRATVFTTVNANDVPPATCTYLHNIM